LDGTSNHSIFDVDNINSSTPCLLFRVTAQSQKVSRRFVHVECLLMDGLEKVSDLGVVDMVELHGLLLSSCHYNWQYICIYSGKQVSAIGQLSESSDLFLY